MLYKVTRQKFHVAELECNTTTKVVPKGGNDKNRHDLQNTKYRIEKLTQNLCEIM